MAIEQPFLSPILRATLDILTLLFKYIKDPPGLLDGCIAVYVGSEREGVLEFQICI